MADDGSISDAALDTLFRKARSHGVFAPDSVSDAQLHAIYEIMKHGPTTANSQPQRILFLRSAAGEGAARARAFRHQSREDACRAGGGDLRL